MEKYLNCLQSQDFRCLLLKWLWLPHCQWFDRIIILATQQAPMLANWEVEAILNLAPGQLPVFSVQGKLAELMIESTSAVKIKKEFSTFC